MGLSERRHQEKRIKQKTRKDLQRQGNDDPSPRDIGKTASSHGALCSCTLCGNPRKHFKGKTNIELSLNERRANDREQSAFGSFVDGAIESLTSLPSFPIHLPELDFEFPDIELPDIDLDF
jgi:hypothetical protein